MADENIRNRRTGENMSPNAPETGFPSGMPGFTGASYPVYSITPCKTATEYVTAVREWLNYQYSLSSAAMMAQQVQMLSSVNAVMAAYQAQQQQQQQTMNGVGGNLSQQPPPPFAAAAPQPQAREQPAQQNFQGQAGEVYTIPQLWKRVTAEFLDFVLLFMMKITLTLMVAEQFKLSNYPKYDLESLLSRTEIDYETALQITSEIVVMEIINRIAITLFETMCLRGGRRNRGAASPGKRMMRLKVVSCDDVVDLPDGKVRVTPARNIGLLNAFIRASMKNFSLAFFFPLCLTALFFQHGRAVYDVVSGSIVVEMPNVQQERDR
ncbi:protein FAM8A1-like [Lingula anatina]|uniref:Protein FAM8A1-like n=1 Tax=Lingula anatina TaxID=7574 RepID=A0A1S3IBX3_LINAN|nr:protein FAM8A1-like [Lingula anatina]|eukprot:XP_013395742.1 protein FAM8A1-like [Lingula anatina]